MISKTYILKTLTTLNRLYNQSSGNRGLLYSKLAIIELCGWIEESMDDIIHRCANRHLKDTTNRDYIKNEIIKKTYGFSYDRHFRKMLLVLIGIIAVEKIEKNIDNIVLRKLKNTLSELKPKRDMQAHTHLKGVMISIDAPSVTKQKFQVIYKGLVEFDTQIRRTKL